jgi:P27 family predicted phage terminase small subunit
MKTGRPTVPTEQRREEGTLRSHHAKVPLISGRRARPKCPPDVTGKAAEYFALMVRELWPARILDRADSLMILTAAIHLETALDARGKVLQLGTVYSVTRGAYNGSPGYKVLEANPAVKIERDCLEAFRQCCDALGISPAARARLANMGVKGASPAASLPGVGAGPTPLSLIPGGKAINE